MSLKVLVKIAEARQEIKNINLKKAGHNDHSKYDYYTPEQVSMMVHNACFPLKLLNTYELIRTENGLTGEVTVTDLESGESSKFRMATDIPQITATNIAQQLGGAVTYSERYLLMSIYDIKDNNLDFDTDKKSLGKSKSNNTKVEERQITQNEVETKWNGKLYKNNTVLYIDGVEVKPPSDTIKKLLGHKKYKA